MKRIITDKDNDVTHLKIEIRIAADGSGFVHPKYKIVDCCKGRDFKPANTTFAGINGLTKEIKRLHKDAFLADGSSTMFLCVACQLAFDNSVAKFSETLKGVAVSCPKCFCSEPVVTLHDLS